MRDRKDTTRHSDLTVMRRLFRQARPYWPHIGAIFLIQLLAIPLALLMPVPLKIAVDSVAGSDPLPGFLEPLVPDAITASSLWLLVFAAALQVLIVLMAELRGLCEYMLSTRTGEGLTLAFRARVFRHVQRLSLLFHDMRGTADSTYRVQYDAPSIQWFMVHGFIPAVSAVVMLGSMIYVTARINGELALVALAISPLLFFAARFYNRRMRPRYTAVKELESNALKVVQEVLSAVRVVKAFGREDSEHERFLKTSNEGVHARVRLAFAEGLFGLLVSLTVAVGTALVLFVGIRNVQAGALSVGELLIVLAYLTRLYGRLEGLTGMVKSLQFYLASAQRVFEVLDELPDVAERPNARPLRRAMGAIEFRDVGFGYDPGARVLQDVAFAVDPGTRLGIAGPTGAGKTTLASLLSRFYDPQAGAILLDGVDLRDYKLADLRNQFAIVLQEPVLFSTSISENIAYARPGAGEDQIVAAAKAANAHDFIVGLPEGYGTLVGERGMRLSGGERQRISLARAFLKDAPILILDEPTSSVDTKTEAGIMETMGRLMEGRTTLMIAHRLSTLEHCDKLLVIEEGRAVLQPVKMVRYMPMAGEDAIRATGGS